MSSPAEIVPIPVHVKSAEPGLLQAPPASAREVWTARYETVQLTANDPVQCILPEDPDRAEAWVIALDNDIIIGTKNQVSATQNTVSGVPYPIGAYIPAKTTGGSLIPFPVRDCDAVFAGVTVTNSNSRVSVAAYYRSKA
jgi:hypothetical protein